MTMTAQAAKIFLTDGIKSSKARIAELKAIEHTDGYIVIVGESARLPMDEVQARWCRVEHASIYWHAEDARYFAAKIVNGHGESGQVVKKVDQIAWEISEQEKLITDLQAAIDAQVCEV